MLSGKDDLLLADVPRTRLASFQNYVRSKKSYITLILLVLACIPLSYVLGETITLFVGKLIQNQVIPIDTISKNCNKTEFVKRVPSADCEKRIVYYHQNFEGEIEDYQVKQTTHLIYPCVSMSSDGDVKILKEETEELLVDLKNKARKMSRELKVMFSIGGFGYHSNHFSPVMSSPASRKRFIDSIADFLVLHKLDGVDIYWVWPEKKDNDKIVSFALELRRKLNYLAKQEKRKDKYLISFALPRDIYRLEEYTFLERIMGSIDFFNVLAFDYFGPSWWPETGPPAPLYSGPKSGKFGNVDSTMKYLTCRTVQPSKLNLGILFVGKYWNNVGDPIDGSDGMWRIAEQVNGKTEGGTLLRYEIGNLMLNKDYSIWHEASKSSYLWYPDMKLFVSYESEQSAVAKMEYAKENNFGGVFVTSINREKPLLPLRKVFSFDLCNGEDKDFFKYDC